MDSPFDVREQLRHFQGVAPLFPLPGTVFFPHILLPLHIFEPRYRQMTVDLLAGDRLLAMALTRPTSPGAGLMTSGFAPGGWNDANVAHLAGMANFDAPADKPPIHRTVCLGRVAAEERLPDGRYYLVLQGLARARVLSEVTDTGLPYRLGRLELLEDRYPAVPTIDREQHWQQILSGFRTLFPDVHLDRMFQQSQTREVPLGVLADVLAYAMKLGPRELQRLLDELDADRRASRVVELMQAHLNRGPQSVRNEERGAEERGKTSRKAPRAGCSREFPPRFSAN